MSVREQVLTSGKVGHSSSDIPQNKTGRDVRKIKSKPTQAGVYAKVIARVKKRVYALDVPKKRAGVVDTITGKPENLQQVDAAERAILKAEVRRLMASSALAHLPTLQDATAKDPILAKETAKLIYQILERLTSTNSPASASTRRMQSQNIPGAPLDDKEFIDPKTKINLLELPKEVYRERADKSEKPESFLRRVWGQHTRHHLLYAEHLRRVDPHLYFGLNYRAHTHDVHLSDYLFGLGVMARQQITRPPDGYDRQAQLLRTLRSHLRSQSLERSARAQHQKQK